MKWLVKVTISIHNYQASIADEGLAPRNNVGINVGTKAQRILERIRMNNQITAKEVADSLSISLRQSERIIASLKNKGLIKRVGSNKSGYWEVKNCDVQTYLQTIQMQLYS